MAQDKGMSYRDALRHPDTKASYQKGGSFFGDLNRGIYKSREIRETYWSVKCIRGHDFHLILEQSKLPNIVYLMT